MPWNPNRNFHSELKDDAGRVVEEECARGKTYTYTAEKDPADPGDYVFGMMDEDSYARDNPSGEDFIRILPCTTNPARTKLSCTFEVPADLADDVILLGFPPDRERSPNSDYGYGGRKYRVVD